MLKKNTEKQTGILLDENIGRESIYDATKRLREESRSKEKKSIPIERIHPFADNPYKVLDNEEMDALVTSINERGILTPLMLRPREDIPYEYDIISGHRRFHAAKKAGLETVPAFVFDVSRDEAAIMVVDSNLHREHILPSEKAFAYKLKADALNHQGKACGQVGHKSRDDISSEDSGRQVQRYIRLTNLIPELLDMLDEEKIAFSVGVELSYLSDDMQYVLLDQIEALDCTPSYAQANHMHKEFVAGTLTEERISEMMTAEKPNQKEKITIPVEKVSMYFRKDATPQEMTDHIMKLLDEERIRKIRRRDRDAR